MKIESKSPILNGQYRATGGHRIIGPGEYLTDIHALSEGLELSREMTAKNSAAGLRIGGSKDVTRTLRINPTGESPEKDAILISVSKAIETVGGLMGGGVLTGQDRNISIPNAELMYQHAPTSIVPYVAPDLSGPPVPATIVGLIATMEAAATKAFPNAPELTKKVIAVQGSGNIGGGMILQLLQRGNIVIASDIEQKKFNELFAKHPEIRSDYPDRFRYFTEEPIGKTGKFTTHIFNPFEKFPEWKSELEVDHIDIISPNAGQSINPETIKIMDDLHVKLIVGAANNVLEDIKRDSTLLAERGILHIPDYHANGGGVVRVDGHLGHDASDKGIAEIFYRRTIELIEKSERENRTPQEIADEESETFYLALPFLPHPTPLSPLEPRMAAAAPSPQSLPNLRFEDLDWSRADWSHWSGRTLSGPQSEENKQTVISVVREFLPRLMEEKVGSSGHRSISGRAYDEFHSATKYDLVQRLESPNQIEVRVTADKTIRGESISTVSDSILVVNVPVKAVSARMAASPANHVQRYMDEIARLPDRQASPAFGGLANTYLRGAVPLSSATKQSQDFARLTADEITALQALLNSAKKQLQTPHVVSVVTYSAQGSLSQGALQKFFDEKFNRSLSEQNIRLEAVTPLDVIGLDDTHILIDLQGRSHSDHFSLPARIGNDFDLFVNELPVLFTVAKHVALIQEKGEASESQKSALARFFNESSNVIDDLASAITARNYGRFAELINSLLPKIAKVLGIDRTIGEAVETVLHSA